MSANQKNRSPKLAKFLIGGGALFAIAVVLLVWHLGFSRESVSRSNEQPGNLLETTHYQIRFTSTPAQAKQVGAAVEHQYAAYATFFGNTANTKHTKLSLVLYGTRDEFRRNNKSSSWAEAFYSTPHCYAYFNAQSLNPYHWMLHEAIHQLTREVSGIKYSRWMEEGLAAYFASSQLTKDGLKLGAIDWNTYPAWGLGGYEYTGDLRRDANAFQFIRLEQLITGKDAPSVDEHFNLYYVSAWSLTHFLIHFEEGKYLEGYKQFRAGDATLLNFVAKVGALDQIEEEWYRYLSLNLSPLFDKQ